MIRFARWIDRLATAELALSALALPLVALSVSSAGARLAALILCALVAFLVFVSGVLFALDTRAQRLDAKLKAGGGIQVRQGKVHKPKKKPLYSLEHGHLVRNLERGGLPKGGGKDDGPRVVGMSVKRTA